MIKEQNEEKRFLKEVRKAGNRRLLNEIRTSSPILLLKGLGMFYFGATSIALSAFGAYQAHFGDYATWARWGLCLISAPVAVVASTLLGRLFVKAARD